MPLELIKFRATTTHLKGKCRKSNSCVGRWCDGDGDGQSLILDVHDTCPSVGQTKRVGASFETCSLHPKRQRWRLHGGLSPGKLLKVLKLKKRTNHPPNDPTTLWHEFNAPLQICKFALDANQLFFTTFFFLFFYLGYARTHLALGKRLKVVRRPCYLRITG